MRTETLLTKAMFAKQGDTPKEVNLPHTWNNLDGQDGNADYWRGLATYTIEIPKATEGKRQFIEFQGANHVVNVYCNNRYLGSHNGGFSTFRFDITDALKTPGKPLGAGGEVADQGQVVNTVTVSVSNASSNIYPQSADFTFFGGLYRDVKFIETNDEHFSMLYHGTNGVYVTPHVAGKTRIDLYPKNAEGCKVKVELKDADGKVVAKGEEEATEHTVIKLDVTEPHLWNGLKDPYCYTCTAKLVKGLEEKDEVTVTYGYRGFHVDPNSGFYLNGVNTPLHGVSRHQDRLNKGWAISKEDHKEDLELIKEVGANTIRLAHYQHDQYFYDLCDHTGMVLWAEIPFISCFNPAKEAHDNTISQMTELVLQNYNHPSIFFWGISNEITIQGESEGLYQNLCELNALVKKLDPTRLTTMAEVSMVPMNSEHVYITDVLSYNHYFGWYVGDVEDNGPWFDKFHALNPDRCLGVSEYGAEAILSWHSAEPDNHDYTEEYAAHYHHEMLKTFAARPYLWSTHVWNMFDFAADARNEGGVKGRNNKGLVTYDRKIKKDAFFIYQAYWTDKPMIHVCGERFINRAPDERNITVYTNMDEVTLVVNGVEVATQKATDHCVVFENVGLSEGENKVTAKSGNVNANTITLKAVAEHDYSYDLPEGNQGANWFNDPAAIAARKALKYPKGYYSIKDKLGTLLENAETRKVLAETLGDKVTNAGSEYGPDMKNFYMMMRLTDMLKMTGDKASEIKVKLNEALTKIKK